MAVKKESTTGLKEVKKDILKMISKLDVIEQNMLNLSIRIKRIENRVGMPR
jgi:septum formation topological specificity factor MinE